MVGAAFFVDLLELVLEWFAVGLIINIFLTPIILAVFWLWFALNRVSLVQNASSLTTVGMMPTLEMIPGGDAVGGFFWTAGIFILVWLSRSEDRGKDGIIGTAVKAVATKGKSVAQDATKKGVAETAKKVAREKTKERLMRGRAKNMDIMPPENEIGK